MKLNLGSGGKKLDGYVNVDCQPEEQPDVLLDIGRDVWPWADNSVDGAVAAHVMEHLPGETFFHFMRELYRVCKPAAEVIVILPYPAHDLFLNDPTHCRAIMPGTLAMFSKRYCEELTAKTGGKLTPFWKYNNVDFDFRKVRYVFDPSVDINDPELEWKSKHLRNFIMEWNTTLTVRK